MSTPSDNIQKTVSDFYADALNKHGVTSSGVDWPDERRQMLRLEQFIALFAKSRFSGNTLLDFGCGYGTLVNVIRDNELEIDYTGMDLCEDMIKRAQAIFDSSSSVRFVRESGPEQDYDFIVASGVFNVKLGVPPAEWEDYVVKTVDGLQSHARKGFAVNFLSSRRDAARKMPHLHYADPLWWLERALTKYSSNAAILHDYDLWDFTLIVKKDPWFLSDEH